MRRILLFIVISLCSSNIIGQNNKDSDFQSFIALIFEKEVIGSTKLRNILVVDSFTYIGNVCDIVHPDNVITLKDNDNRKIKISSSKNIFFHDIKRWIKTYDCNISDSTAILWVDIIIDNKIIRRGYIKFLKENNKWKIREKKIENIDEDFSWLNESSR